MSERRDESNAHGASVLFILRDGEHLTIRATECFPSGRPE